MQKNKKETIIVFSAHSDDYVLGAGGTIAHYTDEGKEVIAIIFSYGEKSHPWLRARYTKEMRAKEAYEAGKILGCEIIFFDLQEFTFAEDYKAKNIEQKLLEILHEKKPVKILTHSEEDPHPDHRAVHEITKGIMKKLQGKINGNDAATEVFSYHIWNPFAFRANKAQLYVDVSETHSTKLRAIKAFRSQRWNAVYPLMPIIFLRAWLGGRKIGVRYAEKFYLISGENSKK